MRLALCSALVLAVPTFAMGGTLPAAARAATQWRRCRGQRRRRAVRVEHAWRRRRHAAVHILLLERLGTRGRSGSQRRSISLIAIVAAASDRSADDVPHGDRGPRSRRAGASPVTAAPPAGAFPTRSLLRRFAARVGIRLLPHGAGLVPPAGSAAGRLGLHIRPRARHRAPWHWSRWTLVRADGEGPSRNAGVVRDLVSPRGRAASPSRLRWAIGLRCSPSGFSRQ